MPGRRPILGIGALAALGLTFEFLSCFLPNASLWPLITFVLYLLLPLPYIMVDRVIERTEIGYSKQDSSSARHWAIFFITGIVVSSLALPFELARLPTDIPTIEPLQCFLFQLGNILCYTSMVLYCIYCKPLVQSG